MSANKPAPDDGKVTRVIAQDPKTLKGTLKPIGGSQSDDWNNVLANQAHNALWLAHSDEEDRRIQCTATIQALIRDRPA